MVTPPTDTRAFFRGECLRRYPAQVAAASWDSVVFDLGRENLVRIPTMEPLRGTREHVGALFERTSTAQELVDTITGGGPRRGSTRPFGGLGMSPPAGWFCSRTSVSA